MRESVVRTKRAVVRMLEWLVIVAVAVLVLDVLWGIFARELGSPSRWTEELATYLLVWVALLGAAVAYDRQEHLGVDYFVKKLAPASQRLLEIIVQLVVLGFAAAAMVYGGYVLVAETLDSGQLTPALQIKMGYVYLAVLISGVFFVLSCLERLGELIWPLPTEPDSPSSQEAS